MCGPDSYLSNVTDHAHCIIKFCILEQNYDRKQVAKVRSWYIKLGELVMKRERERERETSETMTALPFRDHSSLDSHSHCFFLAGATSPTKLCLHSWYIWAQGVAVYHAHTHHLWCAFDIKHVLTCTRRSVFLMQGLKAGGGQGVNASCTFMLCYLTCFFFFKNGPNWAGKTHGHTHTPRDD